MSVHSDFDLASSYVYHFLDFVSNKGDKKVSVFPPHNLAIG